MQEKKTVQISAELFNRICAYHLLDHRSPLDEQIIRDMLTEKLEHIQARTDYTKKLQSRYGSVKQ